MIFVLAFVTHLDVILLCPFQGWCNNRSPAEKDSIMTLFNASFEKIWSYARNNLVFKMVMLEAFVICQVDTFTNNQNIL